MGALSQGFGGVGVPGATLKAWVRFAANGTIIASSNVTSVTRASAGNYQVNFTVAMNSANYVARFTLGLMATGATGQVVVMNAATAAQATIVTMNTNYAATDAVVSAEFYE